MNICFLYLIFIFPISLYCMLIQPLDTVKVQISSGKPHKNNGYFPFSGVCVCFAARHAGWLVPWTQLLVRRKFQRCWYLWVQSQRNPYHTWYTICVENLFQTILRTSGKANWFMGESQSTYSSGRLRHHKKLSDKNTVIKMFTWADSWARQYSFIALRNLLSSG